MFCCWNVANKWKMYLESQNTFGYRALLTCIKEVTLGLERYSVGKSPFVLRDDSVFA